MKRATGFGHHLVCFALALFCSATGHATAATLHAGVAKVDITDRTAGPVNDPLYAKALVLRSESATAVIVTIDAVALAEIGSIANDFLDNVRGRIERELKIAPGSVLVNASHCHGVVCAEIEARTFEAVRLAAANLVPVRVAAGRALEDRISENRRLRLTSGEEVDVRHAYSLPPDAEIAEVGPIDPEIGLLRLDTLEGNTLAVVYNFACHPIQGVPSGGNSADLVGFASQVIEDNLPGAVALFLQGCAGDINPIDYKQVDRPRDAQPLGNLLGLSALKGLHALQCRDDDRLVLINESLTLPRADVAQRIIALRSQQQRLLQSLTGTHLDLKAFLALHARYRFADAFPSAPAYRYLREEALGREDLKQLDATNRQHLQRYLRNIETMEELTRIGTNLALLEKHQATNQAAATRTLDVELVALRVGDFLLLTFPGELTVRIGLNIKEHSSHDLTFVAGYTNGYIYYAPTADQLRNAGAAQEDSETLLAPPWQEIFEQKAAAMLERL